MASGGAPGWDSVGGSVRTSVEDILVQAAAVVDHPIAKVILESVGGWVLILNEARQVLAASPELLQHLEVDNQDRLRGLRPGEVLECQHAVEGPEGCGTSKACAHCGAYLAMMASLVEDRPAEGECRICCERTPRPKSLEFRVKATPLHLGERRVLIFVLQDISDAKRRACLERTFFHDLKNTLQSLQGWSEVLPLKHPQSEDIAQHIVDLSHHLTREVISHELLAMAEQGDLFVETHEFPVDGLFSELLDHFKWNAAAGGRGLDLPVGCTHRLLTGRAILLRVLVNMVKNALEAIAEGERVRVSFAVEGGAPTFRVHNPGFMPEAVALQVFQRSFSTKGEPGRGLGTHGMKLFGEVYLGGQVGFQQDPESGIEFHLRLPCHTLVV